MFETYLTIINWWSVLFVIGLIFYPLTWLIFGNLYDRGYGLSKTFGTLIVSYSIFLLASFKVAPYTLATIYGVIVVLAVVNSVVFIRNRSPIFISLKKAFSLILFQELLFVCGLVGWSYVRSHQPDINGLEKFMDLGFVNSLLRTRWFPPADMWYANGSINYYWYGHYITSLLTKLSHIPSPISYNLMLATILGLTLTSVFSLSSTLIATIKTKMSPRSVIIGALLSAILVTFAGNFHIGFHALRKYSARIECGYPLLGNMDLPSQTSVSPKCDHIQATKEYWYPDATRFIGYDPDVNDKTIHEFPLYSFVVSDLHAHLINLPFVLLYLALLYTYLSIGNQKKSFSLLPVLGLVIGIFFMTNAWDTANYLLLTGIALGISSLVRVYNTNTVSLKTVLSALKDVLIALVVIGSVAYIAVSPFLRHFISIAQGVDFVMSRTPLWQLIVLWGMPLLLMVTFLISIVYKGSYKKISTSEVFVLSVLLTSFALIIIPEIVYVKDIYIASHHRANTMFKLTYQAFVLSYLLSGYIVLRSLNLIKLLKIKVPVLVIFALTFSLLLQYPRFAIGSYYNDLKDFKGLAGDTWFQKNYPHEYAVTTWFNETVEGQPIILEAQGDSYTDYNVISAYTGLPTVNGWFVHEWLWRGDVSLPQARINDITLMYTSGNLPHVKTLLEKYNVSYVIVGTLERQRYASLQDEIFGELGDVVFVSGQTTVYKLK